MRAVDLDEHGELNDADRDALYALVRRAETHTALGADVVKVSVRPTNGKDRFYMRLPK